MDLRVLEPAFRRHRVRFAYAFGSRVSGRARKSSDVDLAVFLSPRLSPRRRQEARLKLLGDLASALGSDSVDLVVLNDAGTLLAFRVTAEGRAIFSQDELARIRFEARAMSFYYDSLPAQTRSAQRMLERVADRGLR